MFASRIFRRAVLVSLVAMPGFAAADISGTASFGSITFTLQDLDPNDGITPAVTGFMRDDVYYAPSGGTNVLRYERGVTNEAFGDSLLYDNQGNPLTSVLDGRPEYYYRASINGRESLFAEQMDAEFKLSNVGNLRNAGLSTMHSDRFLFTVTPKTKVTFHSVFDIDAQITGRDDLIQWFKAKGTMIVWSPAIEGYQEWYSYLEQEREIISADGSDRFLQEDAGFDNSFWNISGQERDAAFRMHLDTEGWWRTPPAIPEADGYAMLGVGLLTLGAIARRGRRGASAVMA